MINVIGRLIASSGGSTVSSDQGLPGPLGSPWPVTVTDGVNAAGVAPASTAATALQPGVVVSLSPNSPLPTGTNSIGAVTQGGVWTVTVAGGGGTNDQGAPAVLADGWPVIVTDGVNTLPTMDIAARRGFIGITDGTTTAGVTAASTAATALQPGVVVALSPNSPLPVGANVIGAVTQSGPWTVTVSGSGTTTADQGTAAALADGWPVIVTDGVNTLPTMDIAARRGFIGITDGTTTAGVTAASTAATALQPGVVVALSPNSPLPVGANVIGAVTQSGTWTFTLSGGSTTTADQGTAAALADRWPVIVTDGTNTMPSMDSAARRGFISLTDGTNTAGITAASTAAVAATPGVVVSLSPNSPIPTGANVIGAVTQSGTWTISSATLATSALQTTGNTSLSSIDGKFPTAAALASNDALPGSTTTIAVISRLFNAARTGLQTAQSGLTAAVSTFLGFANTIPYLVYNVTAPAPADTNAVSFQGDELGNLKVTLAKLIAGENLTDNVLYTSPKAIASLTTAWTVYSSAALIGTAGITIKASPGRLRSLIVTNNGASVYYFQLHNKASAPVNTNVPFDVRYLPAVSTLEIDFGVDGIGFTTGMSYAISSTIATLTLTLVSDVWVSGRWL